MNHNTLPPQFPNQNQPPVYEQARPVTVVSGENATDAFANRTAYIGNTAMHLLREPQGTSVGTVRGTARPVEGTLGSPVISAQEAPALTPGETAQRLAAAGTKAKTANVATELYGRKPATQRELVKATMLASMMQRSTPRKTLRQRANSLFKRQ